MNVKELKAFLNDLDDEQEVYIEVVKGQKDCFIDKDPRTLIKNKFAPVIRIDLKDKLNRTCKA